MKKMILAALMAVFAFTANAQTSEPGTITLTPQVGLLGSNYGRGINDVKCAFRFGVTGGAELGYQVNNWFKPTIGLRYDNTGSNVKYHGHKIYSVKVDYLTVPVLANFYVSDGLALKIGVQPAFELSAKGGDGYKLNDYVNTFDFQIPFGVSYEYMNIVLDARMNVGTGRVFKKTIGEDVLNKVNNQFFTITLGYKFEF